MVIRVATFIMSKLRIWTVVSLISFVSSLLVTFSLYRDSSSKVKVINFRNIQEFLRMPRADSDSIRIRPQNATVIMLSDAYHLHQSSVLNSPRRKNATLALRYNSKGRPRLESLPPLLVRPGNPKAIMTGGANLINKGTTTLHSSKQLKKPEIQGDTEITPLFQIQYWGEAKFSLKDGVYYCPNLNAYVRYTTETGYGVMANSNVSIFYQIGDWDRTTLERVRRNDQILAYWSLESPPHSCAAEDLSIFNWTMTYRQSSDFFLPYGRMTPFNSPRNTGRVKPQLKSNYAEGKTKLASWVASNCQESGLYKPSWSRLSFVRTLQKYMPIDTFGKCGDRPCENCIEQIKFYKFYLAFENDQCEDYITEKLFRNAYLQGTVPIVFGARRSDYEKFVPKGSFIYASDYPTVQSLVSYIKNIDKNDYLYNQFFEWRKYFYAEFIDENDHMDVEKLCVMAMKHRSPREQYFDKTKWFHSSCYTTPIPRDG